MKFDNYRTVFTTYLSSTIVKWIAGSLVVILAMAHGSPLQAQRTAYSSRAMVPDYGERIFADAYVVPTTSADSARISIFFRLANDFLNFTKVSDRKELRGNFRALMAVGVEVRDSMGVIRQRLRWADTAFSNAFDQTNSKQVFQFGWVQFNVGAGSYNVTIEILNARESSQSKYSLPTVSFTPRRFQKKLTSPMFAEPVSVDGAALLRPFVYSGNVQFGVREARALILLADSVNTKYNYQIVQKAWDFKDIRWWVVSDILGNCESRIDRFPRLSDKSTTSAPYLEVREAAPANGPIALVELPIPVANLVPGTYTIKLNEVGTADTVKLDFKVLWEGMPLSLRDVNYAFESMKYILTEEQLDSLDVGSDVERRERLMQWWRDQDPTPTTTYNERMAEYFKRTDHAFLVYSTIQEPDGARSERGKIYILFGAPATAEKRLVPDGEPLEVWIYNAPVKKELHFQLDDRGWYRLVKIVEL